MTAFVHIYTKIYHNELLKLKRNFEYVQVYLIFRNNANRIERFLCTEHRTRYDEKKRCDVSFHRAGCIQIVRLTGFPGLFLRAKAGVDYER